MTDTSSGPIARYWPLENQPFFEEICRSVGGTNAKHLRKAIAEDWSGQEYTIDLPSLKYHVSYTREGSNLPTSSAIVYSRRRILRATWWPNGGSRNATLIMVTHEANSNFDSFIINLAGFIPETTKQGLIGQPIRNLVELPAPIFGIGEYIIADWATSDRPDRPIAILKQQG